MNKLKGITSILGFLLKYAPVIIVIAEAMKMVKEAIDKINKTSPASSADEKATLSALRSIAADAEKEPAQL